jgi:hypothetical protein
MIISPEVILFLINDKKFDDKSILNLARFHNIKVPEYLRKNLENSFSEKHVPSKTTIVNIVNFLKELTMNSDIINIEEFDFLEKIDLSTPKLNLDYLESSYESFFIPAELEGSFINHEIKEIFKVLSDVLVQKEDGEDNIAIEKKILQNKLLSQLDLQNDALVDLSSIGLIHGKFSLNTLLYICGCIDVNNGENDYSNFQWIFDTLLEDVASPKGLESSFKYYVMFLKYIYLKQGKKISFEKIAEILYIEVKSFDRYKGIHRKDHRKVNIKHINAIIDNGGIAYFFISFWRNFLSKFASKGDPRDSITHYVNNYQQFYKIAKMNFNIYSKQK